MRVGRTYPLLQYARNGSNANKFQVWSGLRVDEAGHLQEIPAREVGRRGPALSIEVDEFVVITGSCKAVQCSRSSIPAVIQVPRPKDYKFAVLQPEELLLPRGQEPLGSTTWHFITPFGFHCMSMIMMVCAKLQSSGIILIIIAKYRLLALVANLGRLQLADLISMFRFQARGYSPQSTVRRAARKFDRTCWPAGWMIAVCQGKSWWPFGAQKWCFPGNFA